MSSREGQAEPRVTLRIQSGPLAGRAIELRAGQVGQVGRSGWADLSVAHDASLSDVHFALECGPSACRLRDLQSRGGTLLNGTRATLADLKDGDEIVAG